MEQNEAVICVIEDNKPIRKLFCTLLKKAGFQTFDFDNGETGIEWLRANEPNCVLIDILLPDINGTEILQLIRTLPYGKKVTVIAATGFAQTQDKSRFLDMGFDGYISKPVNTALFVDEVKEIIAAKN